jgi:transglutaminase/protease-like cytokinesis protein 3
MENELINIDDSNVAKGCVGVKYNGKILETILVKLKKERRVYTYELRKDDEYEFFPLLFGDGLYTIQIYKKLYNLIFEKEISVQLDSENSPFLYPNQYVWYKPNDAITKMSFELCKNIVFEKDKIKEISKYILRVLSYDHIKAKKVGTNYIPDIKDVLKKRKGICFDYASVFAAMLRIQKIPTKLIIGYADGIYHAWNKVFIDNQWKLYDLTYQDSGTKINKYTEVTFY